MNDDVPLWAQVLATGLLLVVYGGWLLLMFVAALLWLQWVLR